MKEIKIDDIIIVCAVRYAIGRRTYITGIVSEYVLRYWDEISEKMKAVIIRAIKDHKKEFGDLGDACDEREWNKILIKVK